MGKLGQALAVELGIEALGTWARIGLTDAAEMCGPAEAGIVVVVVVVVAAAADAAGVFEEEVELEAMLVEESVPLAWVLKLAAAPWERVASSQVPLLSRLYGPFYQVPLPSHIVSVLLLASHVHLPQVFSSEEELTKPVNPIPFSFSVFSSPKLHWNIRELSFKLSRVFASAIEIFLISLSPNSFPQLRASLLVGVIILISIWFRMLKSA